MFCNIDFNLVDKEELFTLCKRGPKFIITVNAQFIVLANKNKRFMEILNRNFCTFDGEVPLKFARLKKEYRHATALKGSEIIYDFADYAKRNNYKIFLLGGKKQSNEISVKKLNEQYGVNAAGFSPDFEDYPFSENFVVDSLERIKEFKPEILFVGFGAPKQEFFIDDNLGVFKELGIKYIIGCGGTFEFFAGVIRRAPGWVAKAGLEGFYRLLQEMNKARLNRLVVSFGFFKYMFCKPDYSKKF